MNQHNLRESANRLVLGALLWIPQFFCQAAPEYLLTQSARSLQIPRELGEETNAQCGVLREVWLLIFNTEQQHSELATNFPQNHTLTTKKNLRFSMRFFPVVNETYDCTVDYYWRLESSQQLLRHRQNFLSKVQLKS